MHQHEPAMEFDSSKIEERIAAAPTPLIRLDLLHRAVAAVRQNDPRRGLGYALEACDLAADLNRSRDRAESLLLAAGCRGQLGEYTTALKECRHAYRLFRRLADAEGTIRAIEGIGIIRLRQAAYDRAFAAFTRAIVLWKRQGKIARTAAPLLNIGIIHASTSAFDKAMATLMRSLRIVENDAGELAPELRDRLTGSILNTLAGVYKNLSEFQAAAECIRRALALAERRGEKIARAIALGNLAATLIDMGDPEAARSPVTEALAIVGEIGNREWEGRLLSTLGLLHERENELDQAREVIGRARLIAAETGADDLRMRCDISLGMIHIRQDHTNEAIAALVGGRDLARRLETRQCEGDAEEQLALAYEKLGEHANALRHFRAHMEIVREVEGSERHRAVAEAGFRYEIERLEHSQERLRSGAEQLGAENMRKSNALATGALQLAEQKRSLARVRVLAERIAAADGDPAELARQILKETGRRDGSSGIWEEFDRNLGLLQEGFREELLRRFPELTPAEARVCSLIRIGRSTKEIAGLLGVGYRTVETHRRRIRGKLGIGHYGNLTTFIQSL